MLSEKGPDHADVVNYKAGMVRGASQHVCLSAFVPLLTRAFLSVLLHDDVCVPYFFKWSSHYPLSSHSCTNCNANPNSDSQI